MHARMPYVICCLPCNFKIRPMHCDLLIGHLIISLLKLMNLTYSRNLNFVKLLVSNFAVFKVYVPRGLN